MINRLYFEKTKSNAGIYFTVWNHMPYQMSTSRNFHYELSSMCLIAMFDFSNITHCSLRKLYMKAPPISKVTNKNVAY